MLLDGGSRLVSFSITYLVFREGMMNLTLTAGAGVETPGRSGVRGGGVRIGGGCLRSNETRLLCARG